MKLSKSREKYWLQQYFQSKHSRNVPDHLAQFGSRAADTTDEELFFITQYVRSIDRLALGDSFITAEGLQLLKKLKRVLYLDLSGVPLDDDNIDCILHFAELEYLYIAHTKVTSSGISRILQAFPRLETLIANLPPEDEHLVEKWKKEFPDCDLVINLKG